jgi:hypothetical protein
MRDMDPIGHCPRCGSVYRTKVRKTGKDYCTDCGSSDAPVQCWLDKWGNVWTHERGGKCLRKTRKIIAW